MDHSKTGLFGLDFEWFSLDRFIKKTIFFILYETV